MVPVRLAASAILAAVLALPTVLLAQPREVELKPDEAFNRMTTDEKARHIASRRVQDVVDVKIDSRKFLDSLTPGARKDFLSILTPAQRERLPQIRTSRQFFSMLTPAQRTKLVMSFRADFALSGAQLGLAHSRLPLPKDPGLTSSGKGWLTAAATKVKRQALPRWLSSQYVPPGCMAIGVKPDKCSRWYQAAIEVDYDGSPCNYGPFPTHSNRPPPVGGQQQSPFCSTPDANLYGCGTVAQGLGGIPIENLCDATNIGSVVSGVLATCNATQNPIGTARYTSLVTNCELPTCVTDHYNDPITGARIPVPQRMGAGGCLPCIQQSEPGACSGVDCICPGLAVGQTAQTGPGQGTHPLDHTRYLNALAIPYISVMKDWKNQCDLPKGAFVLASLVYDEQANPTHDPKDWVAGVLADVGGKKPGEISYAMRVALGSPPLGTKVTFRVFPDIDVGWPVTPQRLADLKAKYIPVCCDGNIDNQCHERDGQGTCVRDYSKPEKGSCQCKEGWLPDLVGDCTYQCPGSNPDFVGPGTDSGSWECNGNGRCNYQAPDAKGNRIGTCTCDGGWFTGLDPDACSLRDCVMAQDFGNPDVPPCYGHGVCTPGASQYAMGSCRCDPGWTNGADGNAYCSEQTCPNNCNGHGLCKRDPSGNAYCECDPEYGGNKQFGPDACSVRMCPNCPSDSASCTYDWFNWLEFFTLCLGGDKCERKWKCHCKDNSKQPPQCTTAECCKVTLWGQCGMGLMSQNAGGSSCVGASCNAGGGMCVSGACQCVDGYDPGSCCVNRNQESPQTQSCFGISGKNIDITCSGTTTTSCGTCAAGSTSSVHQLKPTGLGAFSDEAGNNYSLSEQTCTMSLKTFGSDTIGGACNATPGPAYRFRINGNTGTGEASLRCPYPDCSDCGQTIACTVKIY